MLEGKKATVFLGGLVSWTHVDGWACLEADPSPHLQFACTRKSCMNGGPVFLSCEPGMSKGKFPRSYLMATSPHVNAVHGRMTNSI